VRQPIKIMNEPLPFIRRVRRSLVPVANPAPVPAICPHCGKSSAEPASVTSVTLDPTLTVTPSVTTPEKSVPEAPKKKSA